MYICTHVGSQRNYLIHIFVKVYAIYMYLCTRVGTQRNYSIHIAVEMHAIHMYICTHVGTQGNPVMNIRGRNVMHTYKTPPFHLLSTGKIINFRVCVCVCVCMYVQKEENSIYYQLEKS